ncbi:MAG: TolC family protein [Marinilabiliaceae bacterium]|nr:TolC family protein [Marinilabiliaceae bacterium]
MIKYFIGLGFFILSSVTFSQRLLTLEQALELAYEQSPSILQARLSLRQSQENMNAQRAALKSKFRLDATPLSFSRKRDFNDTWNRWITTESKGAGGIFSVEQPIKATDGTISLQNNFNWRDSYSSLVDSGRSKSSSSFNNSLSLRLDQPIFTYNRTKLQLRQLELNLENSKMYYALQELNVEKLVTQAFYQVYQSQMSVNISQEEYDNREKSYDIIKNKVEGGLVAKAELLQAEIDMLSSKSSLYNNEVSFQNDKDQFKQLLGLDLDDDVVVLAEVSVSPVDVDLKSALNYGLANRMELRQREIEIEEGQFDLITTNALNEFKGNISLAVGLTGDNKELPNIYDETLNTQDVQVTLEIPIFDWGEKKARLRAVKAAQEARELNYNDEKVSISLTLRQVYRSLNNLLNQIEIARKNQENAQLNYDINLEKYKNGDLTSMDLNLVQNQLTQNKKSLTDALIQYKLELLNLKIQTLYDFEKKVAVVPNLEGTAKNKQSK